MSYAHTLYYLCDGYHVFHRWGKEYLNSNHEGKYFSKSFWRHRPNVFTGRCCHLCTWLLFIYSVCCLSPSLFSVQVGTGCRLTVRWVKPVNCHAVQALCISLPPSTHRHLCIFRADRCREIFLRSFRCTFCRIWKKAAQLTLHKIKENP